MDNLKEVLQRAFNKSPEEIDAIVQRIREGIDSGKSEVDILTEVFGYDLGTLLKVLGDVPNA